MCCECNYCKYNLPEYRTPIYSSHTKNWYCSNECIEKEYIDKEKEYQQKIDALTKSERAWKEEWYKSREIIGRLGLQLMKVNLVNKALLISKQCIQKQLDFEDWKGRNNVR